VIDIGTVVNGKYKLSRLLGDGGMGSVYEARHAVLGTRVAIKVLHPELARRTGLVERFLQEARVAAQIKSPHVVQVTDVDRTPEGHAFIVMELLEGEPLSAVLDRQRKLPVALACEYTLQILVALEAAHALGVIHRDLKPENVFLTFSGGTPVLKLIDFGIAKARRTDPQQRNLTVAGVLMGTAEYMAPEQARSADKVDARADLYAVGVMLYEMIAGARPTSGEDARIIALKVERGEVVPLVQVAPDVPREIAGLVHRAMAGNPDLRFATATEMRLALQKAMAAKRAATGALAAAGPGALAAQAAAGPGAPMAGPASLRMVGPASGVSPAAAEVGPNGTAGIAVPQAVPPSPGPAPAPADPPVEARGPNTERAPPIVTAMTPPAPIYGAGMAMPPAPAYDARSRSGGGGTTRVVALVALPILIGAGVVMVLMATGAWSPGTSRTDPTPEPTATPQTLATTTTPPAPPPQVDTVTPGVPTLAPTTRTGPVATAPPRGTASVRPPHHAADAGAVVKGPETSEPTGELPPFLIPSNLPFPSAIPGLPPLIPSGLLPPWPAPVPTGGPGGGNGPSPAPTHSSGSI
jgi:serine/threonine-protein kinase